MSKMLLTPYRETEYLSTEESYSIGRFIFDDKSLYPGSVCRIARSRITKLYGFEYQDMEGKCEPIWVYDNRDSIEYMKDMIDQKLIACGYTLLTQEQYDKLSVLI